MSGQGGSERRTEEDWFDGRMALLTEPGCPACVMFKERDDVQEALETGMMVEVGPDHPDREVVIGDTDAFELPAVVYWDSDAGRFVDPT